MIPSEFVASLRARGISVSVRPSGKIRVSPRSQLTPDERAHLRVHSQAIATALLALDALDLALAKDEAVSVPGTTKRVLFRTPRGLLLLAELNEREVRRLASRGRITPAEVRDWQSRQDSRHLRAVPSTSAWELVRRNL
jgi:hypothetical protein